MSRPSGAPAAVVTIAVSALLLAACKSEPAQPVPAAPPPQAAAAVGVSAAVDVPVTTLALLPALPASFDSTGNPVTPEKSSLGRMLFHETRLSRNHDISCNSCHLLDAHGVDGKPTSTGHASRVGNRNSPSVYNAAGHVAQFWDGRAATIEDQAKGPILNPAEMAMPDEKRVVATLASIPEYDAAFRAAFPGDEKPISYDNMARAIGAFERGLVTPSRWDRFVKGDASALTDDEKRGANAFVSAGCVACHSGALAGGGMYQKLGVVTSWPGLSDEGRFAVTKSEADRFVFKVPSLRNVEKTGPWFHDGKVATLEEAVRLMGRHQLGRELPDAEVASIVSFMRSLTGELPADLVAPPELPPSTAKTPGPDPA